MTQNSFPSGVAQHDEVGVVGIWPAALSDEGRHHGIAGESDEPASGVI
jgi:hypothetical protein